VVVCVALTEVLKIVAEDRASHVIDAVANRAQYQFGASHAAAQRFAKGLSGYVVESVVGFARATIMSLTAFGAASVAAFGAFGASAVKAYYESEKLKTSIDGTKRPIVEAVDSMSKAYDGLKVSIGESIAEMLRLKEYAVLAGVAAREATPGGGGVTTLGDAKKNEARAKVQQQIDNQRMGVFDYLKEAVLELAEAEERRYKIEAAQYSPGLAQAVLKTERDIAKAIKDRAEAQRLAADAEQSGKGPGTGDFLSRLREKHQAEAQALRESEAREKAMDSAVGRLSPMDDAAIANRSRDLQSEASSMRAAEVDRQMRDLEALGRKQEQERNQIASENRQKADDAKRAIDQQKQAAAELASVYANVGSQIGGVFNAIIRGGMSAEDVMLKLIGTALSLASSIFLPGAGAAASGIFGFLGSIFGFQDGGVIRAAHGMRVPGVGAGDRVPALLEPGETVVPKGGTQPGFIEEVARAAGGGGGGVTVNLSQSYLVPPDSVTAQRTYQRGLVPVLQDLHSTGRGSVTNPRFRGTARGGKRG